MASAAVEKEESSDGSNEKTVSNPVLAPQDGMEDNNQIQQNQIQQNQRQNDAEFYDSDHSDDDGDDDDDDDDTFPTCYPMNPPLVEQFPRIEYPPDAMRSSPSDRNREFNRQLRDNFVPYAKGMRGEVYRKRTTYEHQSVMG